MLLDNLLLMRQHESYEKFINHEKKQTNVHLVAVKQNTVMGTAEYVIKHDHIYLQGIAVHPDHRRQGICRCLVVATEALARKVKVDTLKLCVIQETGNIEIFKQLGFSIISHAISQGYVNPDGGVVTQVEMERKIL